MPARSTVEMQLSNALVGEERLAGTGEAVATEPENLRALQINSDARTLPYEIGTLVIEQFVSLLFEL
jgi:hypothetical protein